MDVYLGPGKRRDVLLLSSPTWTLDSLLLPIFDPAWSSPQSSRCERQPGNHWAKLVLSWNSHDEIPTIKFSQKRVKHLWHLVPDPIRCAFKSVHFPRSAIQARSVDGPWRLDSLERLFLANQFSQQSSPRMTYQHPTAWTPVLVHEGSPRVPSAWILIHPAYLLRLRPQHLEVLVSLHGDPEVDPLQLCALLCCPSLALLLNHEPANCGVMRWKWASPAPTCCNCWHTLVICILATKVQGNKFNYEQVVEFGLLGKGTQEIKHLIWEADGTNLVWKPGRFLMVFLVILVISVTKHCQRHNGPRV